VHTWLARQTSQNTFWEVTPELDQSQTRGVWRRARRVSAWHVCTTCTHDMHTTSSSASVLMTLHYRLWQRALLGVSETSFWDSGSDGQRMTPIKTKNPCFLVMTLYCRLSWRPVSARTASLGSDLSCTPSWVSQCRVKTVSDQVSR